jgi:hypothetical protein
MKTVTVMGTSGFRYRHCEPTGRANARPMTGSAKQSSQAAKKPLDCSAACAPRNDEFDVHDTTRLINVNASATIEQ